MNKRAVVFIACTSSLVAAVAAILLFSQVPSSKPAQSIATVNSYIVQGQSMDAAATAVRSLDGEITHELGIIHAVAAELTLAQVAALRAVDGVRSIYDNGSVETAGKPVKDSDNGSGSGNNAVYETHYPTLTRADEVHAMGILGEGIGIAVLDTGLWKHEGIRHDAHGGERIDVVYNAISDDVASNPMSGDDPAGHGTHVTSIAVSSLATDTGGYNGIAPGAHLISVQAFDEFGQGTYADVIRAIEWVVANRNKHKIRVLNLSFSAEPRSHYWDDPINQAVMVAWQDEIFVVAAAGNRGPDAMTIGVPGNVPYVLTVGAMTDNYTPADGSDDDLASFSSAGPTVEGFIKPEVVAPGGHMIGLMGSNTYLANEYPSFYYEGRYFEMSGTSQATAVVSGIAALALQAEPWRSVDELKCKILSAAKPAVNADGSLAYSIFQQGAGLVDAYAAVHSQNVDCANNGLHIDNDIDGFQHFGGHANQMEIAPADGLATVRDEFATVGYGNHDGSAAWSGSWVEANDDGSPTSGTVRIENARLRMDNSDSGSLESISRTADLSGASSAALSFDVDGYGAGGLDVFLVEASDDGGQTFVALDKSDVVGTPNATYSYNLQDFIDLSNQVVVRFRLYQGFAGSGQYVGFDNVQIEYGGGSSGFGDYYLMDLEGHTWDGSYADSNGYVWTNAYVWTNGYMWTNAYMWTNGTVDANGYVWTNGYIWTNGYMWTNSYMWTNGYMWTNSLTEMATMSNWVDQE